MRRWAPALTLLLVLAACGSDSSDQAPTSAVGTEAASAADFSEGLTVVASSPGALGPGPQRVLLVVATQQNELLGGPDDTATVTFTSEGQEFTDVPTEFVWGIENVRGFYVANFDFPSAGTWEATLTNSSGSAAPGAFSVSEVPSVPEVGTPAPQSVTRTGADAPLEQITTDPEPEPAFYELTVAEAVTSGKPSVIVFATPAFCTTAICGPTMEIAKAIAPAHPDVNFVHVEVYENIDDPQGELVEVQAVTEWGLQTEPWVFVVDAAGNVSARFEGTVGAAELERALAQIS